MGLIVQQIQLLKDKYERCIEVANKIHTCKLQEDMEGLVYDCFQALKPLSRKPVTVAKVGSTEIILGEWVREKERWHVLGWVVTYEHRFLYLIREFGGRMKPYVRKAIAEDFSSLVDLAVKLVPYDTTEFKVMIPPTRVHLCGIFDKVDVDAVEVTALGVRTYDPLEVVLFKGDKRYKGVSLREVETLIALEDLMDYVVKLYDSVEAQIIPIIEHNNRVMEEMREVAAPYRIAKSVLG